MNTNGNGNLLVNAPVDNGAYLDNAANLDGGGNNANALANNAVLANNAGANNAGANNAGALANNGMLNYGGTAVQLESSPIGVAVFIGTTLLQLYLLFALYKSLSYECLADCSSRKEPSKFPNNVFGKGGPGGYNAKSNNLFVGRKIVKGLVLLQIVTILFFGITAALGAVSRATQ